MPAGFQIGGLQSDAQLDRLPRDAQDVEQFSHVLRKAVSALEDNFMQAADAVLSLVGRRRDQLSNEEGVATALRDDPIRVCIVQALSDQLADSGGRKWQQANIRKRNPLALAQLLYLCGRLFVVLAVQAEDQHRRCIGCGDQCLQQLHAVGICPLEVVDAQHQRCRVGDAAEQFPECFEGAPAVLQRLACGAGARSGQWGARLNDFDALEHWEQVGQQACVPGHHAGCAHGGELAQVAAQRVDQAVEGVVGQGLALVAASFEYDRVAVLPAHCQKLTREACLADTRRSPN